MPGTVLPTFYNMDTIYSRIARLNRPDVPTVDQTNLFNIPERYHLITLDNVQQNFILHRDIALNQLNGEMYGFLVLGTKVFLSNLLNSTFVSGGGTFRIAPYPFHHLHTFNFFYSKTTNKENALVSEFIGGLTDNFRSFYRIR
jgi:hypothetical protein